MPNYRIEFAFGENPFGFKVGIFGVFDGRGHNLIEWIYENAEEEGVPVKDEHWSNRSMTIDDVSVLLGQIREAKKGSRRLS